ncbi:MAG: hypothetical protein IKE43_09805 [Coriobacteriales bacterium]|nr:hypothetical protein [Coriobacteriales bacterium]
MRLPDSEQLNIASLSRLFDNKSECYKLFWFQAILNHVCNGQQDISFEELIDDMIVNAWYMVTEYHLNLGPKDTLEKVVNHISSITTLLPSAKQQEVLEWLKDSTDPIVIKYKRDLTLNVPYRLQAPFFVGFRSDTWNCGSKQLSEKINEQNSLMYYFDTFAGVNTKIHIVSDWMEYLQKNQEILRGWIQYNMILYLQRRNPSVPGISDKLYPPQERKLEKVKNYWRLLLSLSPIHEIYGDNLLESDSISIDHFVPWSYVAHDEFWNLHPTTRAINSRKSNHLPDWSIYFPRFAELEYQSYQMIWKYNLVHSEFCKCAREHLNNPEIRHRLYRKGLSVDEFTEQLKEVVYPIYLSAETCGFRSWEYKA